MRRLFLNRSFRVLALFTTACCLYLAASLFFPLWVLLIGPVLWGIPHLISSLRYSSAGTDKNKRTNLLRFHFIIWTMVFIYRFCVDVLLLNAPLSQHPLLFESLCLLAAFIFQSRLIGFLKFKNIISFQIFTVFILSTYFYPIQTALVALIGHNYLPLIAWYKSCRTRSDVRTFLICSLMFALASLFIFTGSFDFIYRYITPSGSIAFLNWDYSEIISAYAPEGYDYQFWFHIVVLYAFSQAIHYFIWLKAIPENYQQRQHPPSFRWSYLQLSRDFGSGSVLLFIILMAFGTLGWLMFEFQTARLVYFGIASYHGFMEMAAVPFLTSNKRISDD